MGAVLSPTPTRYPALVSARGPPSRGRQKRLDGDRAVKATDLAGSQNEVNRLLDFAKKKTIYYRWFNLLPLIPSPNELHHVTLQQ
jgi:hypothetical protein